VSTSSLLLIGPSTRAMAYSAKRAGFKPICGDLFADTDLQAIATVEVIPLEDYPHGFIERLKKYPQNIPVLYTGGLENHPQVYLELQKQRPVWGYLHPAPFHGDSIRNPNFLDQVAKTKAIHRPRHQRSCRDTGRWLVKPRAGAGGRGIRFWGGEPVPATHFLEEYLEGISLSATFINHGSRTSCLGITEQLVGCDFVHAPSPFSYVGSISPSQGSTVLRCPLHTPTTSRGQMSTSDSCHDPAHEVSILEEVERIGQRLTQADPYLRGLFGVDFILCDGELYLIEVNPRYTASMEVVELTMGQSCLAMHTTTFGCDISQPAHQPAKTTLGKIIYYAPKTCQFPSRVPWLIVSKNDLWDIPEYADIPAPETVIERGQPVLTVFAEGADASEVMHRLQEKARLIEQVL
jgi:uncharacterized protein